MNIKKVLDTGRVVRYHTTLIDKKQNLAEHQWEVGVILCKIYPGASASLILYALTHDCSEIITGDVPAPVKKANPSIKEAFDKLETKYMEEELEIKHPEFTSRELLAVKHADVLSGVYFTKQRVNAGDTEAKPILNRWITYHFELEPLNDESDNLLRKIL